MTEFDREGNSLFEQLGPKPNVNSDESLAECIEQLKREIFAKTEEVLDVNVEDFLRPRSEIKNEKTEEEVMTIQDTGLSTSFVNDFSKIDSVTGHIVILDRIRRKKPVKKVA